MEVLPAAPPPPRPASTQLDAQPSRPRRPRRPLVDLRHDRRDRATDTAPPRADAYLPPAARAMHTQYTIHNTQPDSPTAARERNTPSRCLPCLPCLPCLDCLNCLRCRPPETRRQLASSLARLLTASPRAQTLQVPPTGLPATPGRRKVGPATRPGPWHASHRAPRAPPTAPCPVRRQDPTHRLSDAHVASRLVPSQRVHPVRHPSTPDDA